MKTVRQKSTYSKEYLKYKTYHVEYKKANRDAIRLYDRAYGVEYYAKHKDLKKMRTLFANLRMIIREKKKAQPRFLLRFERETGINVLQFINHFGFDIMNKWVRKDLEIDHVIPLMTLKNMNLLEGANHYTNIRFVKKEVNSIFGTNVSAKVNAKEGFSIMNGIVQLALKNKGIKNENKNNNR
jgi:hypothetical protein